MKGTIERLRIFYAEQSSFLIQSSKDTGTKVIISIPVEGENEKWHVRFLKVIIVDDEYLVRNLLEPVLTGQK